MAAVSSMIKENTEEQFINKLSAIKVEPIDLREILNSLMNWRDELLPPLLQRPLICKTLAENHPVAQKLNGINDSVAKLDERWKQQWEERQPAQNLARYFDDKLMFLVYGKFNAGKSSFCNFIAERFAAQGYEPIFFVAEQGEIKKIPGPFKEGGTETTAEIQGVLLAERMVLLDTPGLHSLTDDNAALTQQFLESADGMLWLSSSTSPGQVQELETLGQELRRRKPLLPVITRSDYIDEDIIDNNIIKVVRNKTDENRSLQEEDLGTRTAEKLTELGVGPEALVPAVSVSVYAAKKGVSGSVTVDHYENEMQSKAGREATSEGDDPALDSGGFYRLYKALEGLLPSILAYKQKKPAEVLLHHIEEDILSDLEHLQKQLQATYSQIEEEIKGLREHSEKWARQIWQQCTADVPAILDTHLKSEATVQELCTFLRSRLKEQIDVGVSFEFSAYKDVWSDSLDWPEIDHTLEKFERVSLENYEAVYESVSEEIFSAANNASEKITKGLNESLMDLQKKIVDIQELIQNNSQSLNEVRLKLVHSA